MPRVAIMWESSIITVSWGRFISCTHSQHRAMSAGRTLRRSPKRAYTSSEKATNSASASMSAWPLRAAWAALRNRYSGGLSETRLTRRRRSQ